MRSLVGVEATTAGKEQVLTEHEPPALATYLGLSGLLEDDLVHTSSIW